MKAGLPPYLRSLPRGRVDRCVAARVLVADAAVHLARRRVAGVVVPARVRVAVEHGVGPGGDGLRAHGGGLPRGRHLARHHALDVVVEAEHVHRVQAGEPQRATVDARRAVEPEGQGAGAEELGVTGERLAAGEVGVPGTVVVVENRGRPGLPEPPGLDAGGRGQGVRRTAAPGARSARSRDDAYVVVAVRRDQHPHRPGAVRRASCPGSRRPGSAGRSAPSGRHPGRRTGTSRGRGRSRARSSASLPLPGTV